VVDKIEKDAMDGTCSTYGGRGGVYRVWWGNLRETDHWEDPGVDGRVLLRLIFRKWDVGSKYNVHKYKLNKYICTVI
jgi:hypothetical protein